MDVYTDALIDSYQNSVAHYRKRLSGAAETLRAIQQVLEDREAAGRLTRPASEDEIWRLAEAEFAAGGAMSLVPICGRCGSDRIHHDSYEATTNYAGSVTGCQNCNANVKSDRERRVAALLTLEKAAAAYREDGPS